MALCHYVSGESIFLLTSMLMLSLYTQTHMHMCWEYIYIYTVTGKIIPLVAKKWSLNAAVVYASASVSVCIFPSSTAPTWQGNSQSSDLKERETGRGGGEREIEGFSRSRTGNRFRWTETGKQTSYLKLYTQFRHLRLSCKVADPRGPEEHHLFTLKHTAAST